MNLRTAISSTALFSLALVITIFNVASAAEQAIATVSSDSSDRANLSYKLIIDSQDGRTIKAFYKDIYSNGKKISRDVISPSLLISGGMVLEQRDKYIVMRLKSANFDLQQGGIVTIDTLYNGAKGERRNYEIQLAQSKTGWLLTNNGKSMSQIIIQTNRMFIVGEVGIKNLVMK